MLRSPLSHVRWRLLNAWDRLLDHWYCGDRSLLGLVLVPVALVAVLGALVRFAYLENLEARAEQQRRNDLRCLAENVYHEGRGEPLDGQYAIAEVTLNRVAAARFPGTVCEVVHERRLDVLRGRYVGAFSWTELEMRPPAGRAWRRAMEVAMAVYDGERAPIVPQALYYHAARIRPSWAAAKQPLMRIGQHVFYP